MVDEEKTAWVSAISAGLGLLAYLVFSVVSIGIHPAVEDIGFAFPLLACMFGIVIPIWLLRGSLLRRSETLEIERDERDADIARRGDQARQRLLLITCVIVLSLALNKEEHFWIAGAAFAGVCLSFVIGAGVQISGYRHGVNAR